MTTPTAPRSTEGEMLQSLIDVAPQAIVAVDLDWHVTRWNRAAEALFGWTAEEIIGQPLLYVPPEQQAEFKRMQQQLNAGKSLGVVETVRQHKDGHEVSVLRAVSVLRDSEGRPVSYVAVLTDLTERKQLEEQLRHAQKMEAIGCLAGGVAHDFNNMLTVIASCAAMMRQRPHSEEDSEDLEAIATSAERAAALTRQLLLFSRKQATTLFKVDANQIVAEMEPMLRRLLRENIALETSVSKDEALVTADPTQLQQVILNLFVNAADAMPDGGALTIETAVVSVDPDRVRAHPRAKGGTHLHLRVRDTGIGMDATTMARIFEPFFTTKPLGKGTGMGLATTYAVVEQRGGHIRVESTPGKGSVFHVFLPCTVARATTAESASSCNARHAKPAKGVTVLLVEDDPVVKLAIRRTLDCLGSRVLDAPDGERALAVAASCQEPIDVLLTDMMMPGMSGRLLAERLTAQRPQTRVIYMSGYTEESIDRRGLGKGPCAFLAKPFSKEELSHVMTEVLLAS